MSVARESEKGRQSGKGASTEAVNAIAYATKYHSEWFWKGALQIRKWRGTAH
jgi:hypothetical protein